MTDEGMSVEGQPLGPIATAFMTALAVICALFVATLCVGVVLDGFNVTEFTLDDHGLEQARADAIVAQGKALSARWDAQVAEDEVRRLEQKVECQKKLNPRLCMFRGPYQTLP